MGKKLLVSGPGSGLIFLAGSGFNEYGSETLSAEPETPRGYGTAYCYKFSKTNCVMIIKNLMERKKCANNLNKTGTYND